MKKLSKVFYGKKKQMRLHRRTLADQIAVKKK